MSMNKDLCNWIDIQKIDIVWDDGLYIAYEPCGASVDTLAWHKDYNTLLERLDKMRQDALMYDTMNY